MIVAAAPMLRARLVSGWSSRATGAIIPGEGEVGASSPSDARGVEVDVRLLEEIRAFPEPMRRKLETRYGIDSAEAFFGIALRNPAGMALALDTEPAEVDRLIQLVEGYLPAGYRERCLRLVRHPGGLIVDPRLLNPTQK
jgi:hypothetical protein